MRALVLLTLGAVLAPSAAAQTSGAPVTAAAPMPAAQQVASAVLPLPAEFRDSATVMGYGADGRLTTLRQGRGDFICLANDPKGERFHVACYHKSLEPFMARGRALRAAGTTGDQVDSVRFAEVRARTLPMPTQPAALYSLTGPAGSYDAATNSMKDGRPLFVIYVPNQTAASTGLSAKPARGIPWIMFPGTPKAHIMFVPSM
ncbi:MAG: hypothetical protein ACREON_00690 [Gemmatimonadaceae bacterium]